MKYAQRTAEDWRKLRMDSHWRDSGTPGFPELTPCEVMLESTVETDLAAVERIAENFGAHSGWLERQSRLALVGREAWPRTEGGFDAIIAGELAGEQSSLLIRRVAEGWRLARIGDRPDRDGEHLSHEIFLAGVDFLPAMGRTFGSRLSYRVYWRHDASLGWRRFAARLLGFD